jgi:hypothetical protein
MRSALYYPHTKIRSEELLKSSLLLWDEVRFITPWHQFGVEYGDKTVQEAFELIRENHCPSDSEKKHAHALIKDLITRPLPQPFYFRPKRDEHPDYAIYPQKLLPETWDMLLRAKVARDIGIDRDFYLTRSAGLSVMSILADCCAGRTRCRITDQIRAYATEAGLLENQGAGGIVNRPDLEFEQLVPISLEVIDLSKIKLKTLIDFRKREAKRGGHAIRDLRHRYVEKLESYVKDLTTLKNHRGDVNEIKRQFREDMKDDVAGLREELQFNANDVVVSKDMLVAAIAGVGTIATFMFNAPITLTEVVTVAGGVVSIGGLLGVRNKFLSSRRSMLQKHPMAYLYELGKSPLAN